MDSTISKKWGPEDMSFDLENKELPYFSVMEEEESSNLASLEARKP